MKKEDEELAKLFDMAEKGEISPKTTEDYKQEIIDASKIAIDELVKVLKAPILEDTAEDLSADKLRNAVAAKKMAAFDAFELLSRIDTEQRNLTEPENKDQGHGLAETRAK